jgi:hypothetical protein
MPAGSAPAASASGLPVTVSWPAAQFPNGDTVEGYTLIRADAAGTTYTVGGTCAGVVTATTCVETVQPGSWTYTDTPIQDLWTGAEPAELRRHGAGVKTFRSTVVASVVKRF